MLPENPIFDLNHQEMPGGLGVVGEPKPFIDVVKYQIPLSRLHVVTFDFQLLRSDRYVCFSYLNSACSTVSQPAVTTPSFGVMRFLLRF